MRQGFFRLRVTAVRYTLGDRPLGGKHLTNA
jgi:hypothetical protein